MPSMAAAARGPRREYRQGRARNDVVLRKMVKARGGGLAIIGDDASWNEVKTMRKRRPASVCSFPLPLRWRNSLALPRLPLSSTHSLTLYRDP